MSKETENTELFDRLTELIWRQDLDEKFKKSREVFEKLENDPDISSKALFYLYFLAGYQSGIINIHRLVNVQEELLDRMISRGETKKKKA